MSSEQAELDYTSILTRSGWTSPPSTHLGPPCRYTHPKQVLVTDGMLSPNLAAYCTSNSGQSARRGGGTGTSGAPRSTDENGRPLASFVFPHGVTLAVQAPAVAFLSSGQMAHPYNMAIGGAGRAYVYSRTGQGRRAETWQPRCGGPGVLPLPVRGSQPVTSLPPPPRGRRRLVAGGRRPAGSAGLSCHV